MLKKTLILISFSIIGLFSCQNKQKTNDKITSLRKQHEQFLLHSPFAHTQEMSKAARKALGIPPNKYAERQWELTMNPKTGRPTPEKLLDIRKEMIARKGAVGSVPGIISNPWVERGPGNVGGRTKAVLFDPNDPTLKRVFAGSVSGGLWVNDDITNPNSTWQITGLPHNLQVSSIAVDPNNSQIFYLGTGESYTGGAVNGTGLWKSSDGGMTWTHIFGGKDGDSQLVSNATFSVSSPSNLQGDFFAVKSAFGDTDFADYSGNLVLADDGSSDPTLACNALVNAAEINGNIAVIERGTCYFVDKVLNAQNAGAIGVLMINNVPGAPITMGGTNASITIPAVMISKTDGAAILAALNNNQTINVTITNTNSDIAYGYRVPGITHINDVVTRNLNGTTEIYVSAGNCYYSDASAFTVMGYGQQGVYKSTDGGANWTQVTMPNDPDGNPFTPFDLEIAADNKIWLTTTRSVVHGTDNGAILSSDNGNSFNVVLPINNVGRMELAVSKTDPGKMYLIAWTYSSNSSSPSCIKTTDAFVNINYFTKPDGDATPANDFTNGQGYYDLMLEVDPNNDDVVYIGGIDLFKSTNGGNSWTQISSYYGSSANSIVHPDQHGMAFGDSQHLLFANDGGVYYSSNSGVNILVRNKNYVTAQFYHMAVAPTSAFSGDYFMAGAQDNGTQLFENAPQSVSNSNETQGGDGAYCFFDQDGTDKYRISNYVYNNHIKLYNYNTSSWKTVNSESTRHGDFINQEELDSNLNILYSNYSVRSSRDYAIRRYSNLLGSITTYTITDDMMNAPPTAMKVSPYTTNSTKLIVGLDNGRLLKIENANASPSFTDLTGNDFLGSISDIEFGANENEIYVTMYNYGVVNIYYTNDGGTTWQNKEGDFPDMPVNTIMPNPLNNNEVIIGTDLGVWASPNFNNPNPNWYPVINGMSDVKVTDLELRDDNMVFAATYGRGVFSGQFTADTNLIKDQNNVIVQVFPNPVTDLLNVELPKQMNATAGIYDINGKLVLNKTIENKKRVQINTAHLKKGLYILQIKEGDTKYSAKFLVK